MTIGLVGHYCALLVVLSLQHLYNLVHVDLSYNSLRVLEAAHTRLGNIKTLNLAGNQLDQLIGLTKLYSLVNLDLSHNQLAQVIPLWTPGCQKLSSRRQKVFVFPLQQMNFLQETKTGNS